MFWDVFVPKVCAKLRIVAGFLFADIILQYADRRNVMGCQIGKRGNPDDDDDG